MELSNRIAKAAMEENMADRFHAPSDALLKLYEAWADGGAGLILTGNVMMDMGIGQPRTGRDVLVYPAAQLGPDVSQIGVELCAFSTDTVVASEAEQCTLGTPIAGIRLGSGRRTDLMQKPLSQERLGCSPHATRREAMRWHSRKSSAHLRFNPAIARE